MFALSWVFGRQFLLSELQPHISDYLSTCKTRGAEGLKGVILKPYLPNLPPKPLTPCEGVCPH